MANPSQIRVAVAAINYRNLRANLLGRDRAGKTKMRHRVDILGMDILDDAVAAGVAGQRNRTSDGWIQFAQRLQISTERSGAQPWVQRDLDRLPMQAWQ